MHFQYSFEHFKHLVPESLLESPVRSPLQSIQRSNVSLKQLFEEYQLGSDADYILYLDASNPEHITLIQPPSPVAHDLTAEISFAANKESSTRCEETNLANIITTSFEDSRESLLLNISSQIQDLKNLVSNSRLKSEVCGQSGNNQKMSTDTQSSRRRSAAFSCSSSKESGKQELISDFLITESISQGKIIAIEISSLEQIREDESKKTCFKKPLRQKSAAKPIVRTSKKKELRHRVK